MEVITEYQRKAKSLSSAQEVQEVVNQLVLMDLKLKRSLFMPTKFYLSDLPSRT